MQQIYVQKNVKSLHKLGMAIAKELKCGNSVLVKYGLKERDIIVRFEKKLQKLYDDVKDCSYPDNGYVLYTPKGFIVFPSKPDFNGKQIELIYSSEWYRYLKYIVNIVKDLFKSYNNREKW